MLYVTGALNTVLSLEHQKEIRRYIYNHQASLHYRLTWKLIMQWPKAISLILFATASLE